MHAHMYFAKPGAVEGDFASAISLFHAYELLLLHGMKSFYQFLTNTFSAGSQHYKAKAEILKNPQFRHIVKRLKERVDSSERSQFITDKPTLLFPRTSGMPSKTEDATENDKNSFFYSHPKLRKLEDIVLRHFRYIIQSAIFEKNIIVRACEGIPLVNINCHIH